MTVHYFDYLTHTRQVLLHQYPHAYCDGVALSGEGRTVVCFADRSLKNRESTLAVLRRLNESGTATSPAFSRLVEFLEGANEGP